MLILIIPIPAKPSNNTLLRCVGVKEQRWTRARVRPDGYTLQCSSLVFLTLWSHPTTSLKRCVSVKGQGKVDIAALAVEERQSPCLPGPSGLDPGDWCKLYGEGQMNGPNIIAPPTVIKDLTTSSPNSTWKQLWYKMHMPSCFMTIWNVSSRQVEVKLKEIYYHMFLQPPSIFSQTSYADISIVIPQSSSSSFRSLQTHPATLHQGRLRG